MLDLFVLTALSQASADPVQITRTFREGEKLSYVVIRKQKDADLVMKGSGGTWRVDLEALSVRPEETKLKLTRSTIKLDAEGSPALSDDVLQQLKKPAQMQLIIRSNGRFEVSGDTTVPGGFEGWGQWYRDVMLGALPTKAVVPGDTWEEPYGADLSPAFRPVGSPKILYRFEGLETLSDKPAFKVTATVAVEHRSDAGLGGEGPTIALSIRRELRYTLWLAPPDGRLLKNTGTETLTLESTSQEFPFGHSFTVILDVAPLAPEPKRNAPHATHGGDVTGLVRASLGHIPICSSE